MPQPRRKSWLRVVYAVLTGGSLFFGILYLLTPPRGSAPQGLTPDFAEYGKSSGVSHISGSVPEDKGSRLGVPKGKVLVFVLDDVGQSVKQLEPFLAFPGPMTVAVIPFLPQSREASAEATFKGKDVILHMPMQAVGGQDPGKGAIFVSDSAEELTNKLFAALSQVPDAKGVNNHMGSAVTANLSQMVVVLLDLKARGLYFFDSMTTPHSAALKAAQNLGLRIEERDVFLDNEKSRDYILQAIEEGKKIASTRGRAIMIGHVWSSELAQILMEVYPHLIEEGYSLEDLSRIAQGEFNGEADHESSGD